MKKLLIICSIIFVCGMIAGSALAQECATGEECNDGLYCTGEETCLGGICQPGTPVECPDDALFCNGSEYCDEAADSCASSGNPCDAVAEACDEEEDICVPTEMVSMDIKPGTCQNPLNVRSRGVLPVVIHGSEGFDVEAIDPASIGLSREGVDVVVPPLRWSYEDVGTPNFNGELCACDDLDDEEVDEDDPMGDGCMDLTLKFSVPALVEALGLAELGREKGMPRETILLTLVATAADGAQVMGQDCVQIINNWKWWEGPKGPNRPEEPNLPEKPKGPKGPKRK